MPIADGLTGWHRAANCVLVGGVLSLSGSLAAAETQVLTAVADATLVQEPTGALANGAGTNLFAGRVGANAGSTLRRALVRFDLSALPPGAIVQSASFTLNLTRSRFAGDLPMSLHRVTAAWNEGPALTPTGIGEPSQPGDVTWLHRNFPSQFWSTPGGDFVAQASASRIVSSVGGPKVWESTPQLVADVQSWVNQPADNHGWILLGFEGSGTSAKGFSTRETALPQERPQLVVQYTLPAPVEAAGDVPLPPWAWLMLGGGLLGLARRRWAASAALRHPAAERSRRGGLSSL